VATSTTTNPYEDLIHDTTTLLNKLFTTESVSGAVRGVCGQGTYKLNFVQDGVVKEVKKTLARAKSKLKAETYREGLLREEIRACTSREDSEVPEWDCPECDAKCVKHHTITNYVLIPHEKDCFLKVISGIAADACRLDSRELKFHVNSDMARCWVVITQMYRDSRSKQFSDDEETALKDYIEATIEVGRHFPDVLLPLFSHLGVVVEPTEERVKSAVDLGLQAFWAEVSSHFPEAEAGDYPPDEVALQEDQQRHRVLSWLKWNHPAYKEGPSE
jgi:hypothetical protein